MPERRLDGVVGGISASTGQLVDRDCFVCAQRIIAEPMARFCRTCGAAVHTRCFEEHRTAKRCAGADEFAQVADGPKPPRPIMVGYDSVLCPKCRLISSVSAIECSGCGWNFERGVVTAKYTVGRGGGYTPDDLIKLGGTLIFIGLFVPIVGLPGILIFAIGLKRSIWPSA